MRRQVSSEHPETRTGTRTQPMCVKSVQEVEVVSRRVRSFECTTRTLVTMELPAPSESPNLCENNNFQMTANVIFGGDTKLMWI